MGYKTRIVVLDGSAANPGDLSWAGLEALGELTVYDYTSPNDIVSRIGDAGIIYTNKTLIAHETLNACPSIRFIGVLATGTNNVDLQAAKERCIPVCNIPAYSTQAVAQFTFALLLEICHHIGHHNNRVQQGRWSSGRDFCFWDYPLVELAGKTIGIIGYGRIGQATANIARAFGMRVIACSRSSKSDCVVPLDALLAESDVISLHCPLTDETKHIINADTIAKMKQGVIIINTARGPLIDETALVDAVKSGQVYAAGLDVVSAEPIKPDSVLLGHDNIIITPHIAWAPKEARQRLMDIAVENLAAFLRGMPQNVVNG